MTANKYKNRILTRVGRAIAELRAALESTEDFPEEAAEIQDRIEDLINLSNQVEQI